MTDTTPPLRAQVLALRRTQSAKAVSQALNIPVGTVKAITSRAGLTRDNQKLREFCRLPEPTASNCTALQPPVAPPSNSQFELKEERAQAVAPLSGPRS